jgi:anionic cell wall polymer biosynthesis LytR-Cps2A-Psr (LCP) family protein
MGNMKYTLLKNKVTGERSVYVVGQGKIKESEYPLEYARLRKLALSNLHRVNRDQAMRDCGLVRVRGALGGVYWE